MNGVLRGGMNGSKAKGILPAPLGASIEQGRDAGSLGTQLA